VRQPWSCKQSPTRLHFATKALFGAGSRYHGHFAATQAELERQMADTGPPEVRSWISESPPAKVPDGSVARSAGSCFRLSLRCHAVRFLPECSPPCKRIGRAIWRARPAGHPEGECHCPSHESAYYRASVAVGFPREFADPRDRSTLASDLKRTGRPASGPCDQERYPSLTARVEGELHVREASAWRRFWHRIDARRPAG